MFLKPTKTKNGYYKVNLSKNGEIEQFYVHRLVAETYIPNPLGLPEVNHLDEIKGHNYANNLTWVTREENLAYGTRVQRGAEGRKKPVYCVELDKIFPSIKEAAAEFNITASNISSCVRGNSKTAAGYHWQFALNLASWMNRVELAEKIL